MHTIVRYTGTKREKYQRAIQDARDFLGKESYDRIMAALVSDAKTGRVSVRTGYKFMVQTLAMLCGIEGIPAKAMARQAYHRAMTDAPQGVVPC